MPELGRIRILGQTKPAGATNTILYQVSTGYMTVISSIIVCNVSGGSDPIRIFISAGTNSVTSNQDEIYFDVVVDAGDSFTITAGITLQEEDTISVWSNGGRCVFSCYGEIMPLVIE